MCGIYGYVSTSGYSRPERTTFMAVADAALAHRGPDGRGAVQGSSWGLGHRRLAIVDRSEAGSQPMTRWGLRLVFNGMIYNYRELRRELQALGYVFTTETDSEVLLAALHAWGLSALPRLNGMFAFAFLDEDDNLTLVRDRFGVKPLYYTEYGDSLYFASEVKPLGLLRARLSLNVNYVADHLANIVSDGGASTWFEGIQQLPPGSFMTVSNNRAKTTRWYVLPEVDETSSLSLDEWVDQVEELLISSISLRLRADVPVGITLSGGIDSTLLYILARKVLQADLQVFSYVHQDPRTSEEPIVGRLAHQFGDEVQWIRAKPSMSLEAIKESVRVAEYPIWSLSGAAYMDTYAAVRASGVEVILEGHGSDEFLAGYPVMMDSRIAELFREGKHGEALRVIYAQHWLAGTALANRESIVRRIARHWVRKETVTDLNSAIARAVQTEILPLALRGFDRFTMHFGIESRAPFLDYRLVESFRKMPSSLKVGPSGSKVVLRRLLDRHGASWIHRKRAKIGFSADIPRLLGDPAFQAATRTVSTYPNPLAQLYIEGALRRASKDKSKHADFHDFSKILQLALFEEDWRPFLMDDENRL